MATQKPKKPFPDRPTATKKASGRVGAVPMPKLTRQRPTKRQGR